MKNIKYLTTYEKNSEKLKEIVIKLIKRVGGINLVHSLIVARQHPNELSNYKNTLIDCPVFINDLAEAIESLYGVSLEELKEGKVIPDKDLLENNKLSYGEQIENLKNQLEDIGIDEEELCFFEEKMQSENVIDEKEKLEILLKMIKGIGVTSNSAMQLEGITTAALLVVISNNCKKHKAINKEEALVIKDEALSDLIAATFIYENTTDEKGTLSYGTRDDRKIISKETFAIDIPYIDQICVHYGNQKDNIFKMAKNKIKSILDIKKEYFNQISDIEYDNLLEKLNEENYKGLLPEYQCELYEHNPFLPLEENRVISEIYKKIKKTNNSNSVLAKYNPRELHGLGVKLRGK